MAVPCQVEVTHDAFLFPTKGVPPIRKDTPIEDPPCQYHNIHYLTPCIKPSLLE